ncbi:zinc finger protein [Colletotrichum karsti]|uniref:Zinc finger protein n=1 Tax=Colletotrichum karsti TaxID=1095194 RepID=A0A9P6I922_9PEZI|nr:zinc finger protein [Colletotrichum karsti]KAF9879087.1 zinc finger protein [Colletotrichum karsti]
MSTSDLVTRHERTLHADQWQSLNHDTPAIPAFGERDGHELMDSLLPDTIESVGSHKDALLGLSTAPADIIPGNSAPLLEFKTTTTDATEAPLDQSVFDTSDVNIDSFNDLSPSFFDPFLGDVFDHFALPTLECAPDTTVSPQDCAGLGQTTVNDEEVACLQPLTSAAEDCMLSDTPEKEQYCRPRITRSRMMEKQSIIFTEKMRAHCIKDMTLHLTPERLGDFKMPDTSCLQKCLNSYIESFHVHFPFLHLATLDLETAPSPLTLSICAVGALHRLDRKLAASLYLIAERVLGIMELDGLQNCPALLQDWSRPRDMPPSGSAPLTVAQARLILVFFAAFSGEPQLIRQALIDCGFLSADFRARMSLMRPGSTTIDLYKWETWAEHESTKRLMCSSMMLGNLLVITYGIAPGFSILEETNIEMPVEDALWEAKTASQWELLAADRPRSSSLDLREATSAMFGAQPLDRKPDVCWQWSPFAASVVLHSVAIAVWYLTQGQQACRGGSTVRDSWESQDADQIAAALSRCRDLLAEAQAGADGTWNEAESPLLFNAFAILRVSYGRAFIKFHSLDRSLLFKESSQVILPILRRYFEAVQDRDPFMTMAVGCALEGFAIPIRAGILLMRKTAAFKWSVEHALASWDAGLLVTKWVYAVECLRRANKPITPEERQVLDSVTRLLDEVDTRGCQRLSLAAELARMWASVYDDTWVWGVAPRIGWVLRELANMYETGIIGV